MRTVAVVALGLVACGTPRPAPVLGNTTTPSRTGPIVPEEEPANCKVVAWTALRVAGERARADVIACDLGEQPADGHDADSGLTIRSWEGYLKVTPARGRTSRQLFAAWTDGWEWGGSIGLEGVLVATNGSNDAVLVMQHDSQTDVSSMTMMAFAVVDGELVRLETWTHDSMDVTFSKAQDLARVRTCVFGDPSLKHAGCSGRDDADPGLTHELRWSGTKLDDKGVAP